MKVISDYIANVRQSYNQGYGIKSLWKGHNVEKKSNDKASLVGEGPISKASQSASEVASPLKPGPNAPAIKRSVWSRIFSSKTEESEKPVDPAKRLFDTFKSVQAQEPEKNFALQQFYNNMIPKPSLTSGNPVEQIVTSLRNDLNNAKYSPDEKKK